MYICKYSFDDALFNIAWSFFLGGECWMVELSWLSEGLGLMVIGACVHRYCYGEGPGIAALFPPRI